MREIGFPALAITLLAAMGVAAGLWVAGGPGQGRMERRDETRLQDLGALSAQVECLAREAGWALPEALKPTPSCPGEPRGADPHTGAAYRYERVDVDSYRLCADFETDLATLMPWNAVSVDAQAGCIAYSLPLRREG